MQLEERLGTYEVTAVPVVVPVSRPLRLVWIAPDDDAQPVEDDDPGAEILPLLAPYRITRVPGRVAS